MGSNFQLEFKGKFELKILNLSFNLDSFSNSDFSFLKRILFFHVFSAGKPQSQPKTLLVIFGWRFRSLTVSRSQVKMQESGYLFVFVATHEMCSLFPMLTKTSTKFNSMIIILTQ